MTEAQPAAGDVSFTYNAQGQRTAKETPAEVRRFLYDFQRLVEERDDVDSPLVEYQFSENGYGDLVSEYDFDDDETYGHAYDAQWSTEALLDESESQQASYKYRAFGLETDKSGTADTNFNFVGKQGYYHDAEIDLFLLGSGTGNGRGGRHYDPATGRFLSEDPAKDDLNDYRYVKNNPVNVIDPSGQQGLLFPGITNPEVVSVKMRTLFLAGPWCW